MPDKSVYQTLVLGTWNIRNFDDNRFGHGNRLEESLFYIAEVISAFDVIAVQEICRDIKPLRRVMELLGSGYDMILTDVTEGPSGNKERACFIYNKNKVEFRNVAGEIVLPFKKQISDVTKQRQFARTPFTCGFKAGWFEFMFSSVHIYYGKQSKKSDEYKRRVKEILAIVKYLKTLAKKERNNHILVGDFNIDAHDDKAFNALQSEGFEIFQNKIGSNAKQNKFYDQISWLRNEKSVRQSESARNQGVLNVFNSVFREQDYSSHRRFVKQSLTNSLDKARLKLKELKKKGVQSKINKVKAAIDKLKATLDDDDKIKKYYINDWRTFQISDHLPLWIELEVNYSSEYLEWLKQGDFDTVMKK